MPLFVYKAQNKAGKIFEDTIQSKNMEEAADQLISQGLTVLSVKESGSGITQTKLFKNTKISVSEKAAFCRFMAVMLRAGLSVPESLEIIKDQTANTKLKSILADLSAETRKGKPLSSGLMKHEKEFDQIFLTMVKAGEQAGTLEQSFNYLSEQLSSAHELTQNIKSALMYPAVVIVAMIGVGLLMLTFVLPKISEVFSKMDIELPALTEAIFAVGNFVGGNIPLVIGSVVGFAVLLILLFMIRATRTRVISFMLRLPVARDIVAQVDISRFSSTLSTLLRSGVPILDALNVASEGLSQPKAREKAKQFSQGIEAGESLSDVLIKAKVFPLVMVQTVKAGEKTGSLEDVLSELSQFYEREVEHSLKRFTSLLEPVLMLAVGISVGAMVILMIAPIYSVVGGLQSSVQR